MASTNRSEQALLLICGFIHEFVNDKIIPKDVANMCWSFFFTPFESSIISSSKDVDNFLELISEKIPIERMNEAKLLFKGTRDGLRPFPYNKLTHMGPYLFVIESTRGHVFGGYCSVDIQKKYRRLALFDKDTFLWVLKGVSTQKPVTYDRKHDDEKASGESIEFDAGSHYWFVFGANLLIFDSMDDYHYGYCKEIAGYYIRRRYNVPDGKSIIGSNTKYRFQMAEIEIFSVSFNVNGYE